MTLAIRFGETGSKHYHTALTLIGVGCFIIYAFMYCSHWYQCLYFLSLIPFLVILRNIYNTKERKMLDPYLKYTSMSTFFLAILFVISINLN